MTRKWSVIKSDRHFSKRRHCHMEWLSILQVTSRWYKPVLCTCRVKFASTLPAWFCETHIKGPESSGLAWVKTKVEDFSKFPVSWIMNSCCPLLTRELFRISVPSRYQWIFEEGTELMEHDKVAFSPEKKRICDLLAVLATPKIWKLVILIITIGYIILLVRKSEC